MLNIQTQPFNRTLALAIITALALLILATSLINPAPLAAAFEPQAQAVCTFCGQ
ncbi:MULTISPECIES: hypothetical protein [Herpetosiphon]|uniref:hypothetical protein n=1 Tax=Herpetosiphon TaxID=64 RepID=UPI001364BA71|nr:MULTISPECIES: hypothetical protein [Herpetosiphon]MBM7844069.1 uncharacterized protein (DUF58 family) [Herpetosiphon giganteus]